MFHSCTQDSTRRVSGQSCFPACSQNCNKIKNNIVQQQTNVKCTPNYYKYLY